MCLCMSTPQSSMYMYTFTRSSVCMYMFILTPQRRVNLQVHIHSAE